MRKNWLAQVEANAIRSGVRRLVGAWGRVFRRSPLVPESQFQDADEPYPGHWRQFPASWPQVGQEARDTVLAALDELPDTWRRVLEQRDVFGRTDAQVAAALGLSVEQERDIVTAARAALRARVAAAIGDRQ